MKVSHGSLNSTMKYVVTHVPGTDQLSLQIRVKAGSRDETKTDSGISHLLEHMFFQGSQGYPTVQALETEIYRCGGVFNAFTSQSETVYHIECISTCAESICKIASDALYRSLLKEENLENEKKVVLNELKGYQSSPSSICSQGLQELAFRGTRLAKDIAGTPQTIQKITVKTLKNYLNAYYGQGLIISLTSSLSVAQGRSLLRQYFSETPEYPCQPIPRILSDRTRLLYPQGLPRSHKEKIRHLKDTSEQSYLGIAYPSVPYSETKDRYTMILISELLTGYMSSYLYQELRHERGLIYNIHSGSEWFEDLGIFKIFSATRNQKESVVATLELILHFLDHLGTFVQAVSLERAQDHLVNRLTMSKAQVHEIGYHHSQDLAYLGKILTRPQTTRMIRSITVPDIQRLCTQVFQRNQCSLCYTGTSAYL